MVIQNTVTLNQAGVYTQNQDPLWKQLTYAL